MRKIIIAAILSAFASNAFAQSSPSWTYGYVPTTAQWNAVFAGKQDYLGASPLLTPGGIMTGRLVTAASSASIAGFNLPPGTAPASPVNGDLWFTPVGVFARANGLTINLSGGATTGTDTYSITSYGAVCDGVADDAIAIAAAITALNATGGQLVFPNSFCVSSTVQTITVAAGKNVTVSGSGPGISGLIFTSNTANGLVFNVAPADGIVNVVGLSVLNNTASSGSAIKINGNSVQGQVAGPSFFSDINIGGKGISYADSITKGWAKGLDFTDFSNVNVKTVSITNLAPVGTNYGTGIGLSYHGTSAVQYPVGLQVNQLQVAFGLKGLFVDGYVQGVQIEQSSVIAAKQGFVMSATAGNQCSVIGGETDTADEGVYIENCGGGVVQSNWMTGGRTGGTLNAGVVTLGPGANNVTVAGNFIGGISTNVGIKVAGGWNMVNNNTFANVGTAMISSTGNVASCFLYNINASPGSTTTFTDTSGTGSACYIDRLTRTQMGGLGIDASASTGVPLFATGTVTMTATTGTSDFVRKLNPVFPNTGNLYWRNAANSADYSVFVVDGADNIQIGGSVGPSTGIFFGGVGLYPTGATQDIGAVGAKWRNLHHITSVFYGATSGSVIVKAPAVAGSNTLTLPAGTTDFSATGGTSQVVKQTSAGGALTVARLACADLSDATAACSNSVAAEQARLSMGSLSFSLASANFNSTADQPIAITLPTGFTRYRIQNISIDNPSTSLTTAVGGIYTAASKGGIAIIAAATAYSSLTTNAAGTSGSLLNPSIVNGSTAFYNSATLYLSLTTPQGAPATADVTVFIQPLP